GIFRIFLIIPSSLIPYSLSELSRYTRQILFENLPKQNKQKYGIFRIFLIIPSSLIPYSLASELSRYTRQISFENLPKQNKQKICNFQVVFNSSFLTSSFFLS
ncbi:hypothetical protein, partial [Dapis sp. BLCC M172]|uniref:hypothetical protein n=1 Tax=Dapis sp. BLCC M172 TaxID=2975281 RepID=UPI003CE6AB98